MELLLDRETHQYTLDGQVLPASVTQMLDDLGFVSPWCKQEGARVRGTHVHEACHYYDDDDLRWSSVRPEIIPYVQAWIRFRRDYPFEILEMETPIYHPIYKYPGTPDRVVLFTEEQLKGVQAILDIKSGAPSVTWALQQMGYKQIKNAEESVAKRPLTPYQRWCVQLKDNGEYERHIYNDAQDVVRWNAVVTVWQMRFPNGKEH